MTASGRHTDRKGHPGERVHRARTVEELTEHNIRAISRMEELANSRRTRGDVIADAIAAFCGSMVFVWAHVLWFGFWVAVNTLPFFHKRFDPYPFQFLTLIVSLEAIFLSTFILISQNRQQRTAERRNFLDLQINLLSEQENSKMLTMLEAIMKHVGAHGMDPEVKAFEQATHPEKLMEQIEEALQPSPRNHRPPAGNS